MTLTMTTDGSLASQRRSLVMWHARRGPCASGNAVLLFWPPAATLRASEYERERYFFFFFASFLLSLQWECGRRDS